MSFQRGLSARSQREVWAEVSVRFQREVFGRGFQRDFGRVSGYHCISFFRSSFQIFRPSDWYRDRTLTLSPILTVLGALPAASCLSDQYERKSFCSCLKTHKAVQISSLYFSSCSSSQLSVSYGSQFLLLTAISQHLAEDTHGRSLSVRM